MWVGIKTQHVGKMKNEIFISYKRGADSAEAKQIFEALSKEFTSGQVFMDIDGIPLGTDFVQHIRDSISGCSVVLLIMGEGLLKRFDELQRKDDFMRIELEAALDRDNVRIVPVLFDGVQMPPEQDWPEELSALARRGGMSIPHEHSTVVINGRLIPELLKMLPDEQPNSDPIATIDLAFQTPPPEPVPAAFNEAAIPFAERQPALERQAFTPNKFSNDGIILEGHIGEVRAVAVSPDGQRAVSTSDDGQLRFWASLSDQQLEALEADDVYAWSLAFSPDGTKIACGLVTGAVQIWEWENDASIVAELTGHEGIVTSIAFSTDGTRIVSGDSEGVIWIWNVAEAEELCDPIKAHEGNVKSVAFSFDGTRIASGGEDGLLRIWSSDGNQMIGSATNEYEAGITSLAFSPTENKIATGLINGVLLIWDSETCSQIDEDMGDGTMICSKLVYSGDGSRIIAGGFGGFAAIWQTNTLEIIDQIVEKREEAAPSPIGNKLAFFRVEKSMFSAFKAQDIIVRDLRA